MDITGARYARDVWLTDHARQTRGLAHYRGKLVAVLFAFTHCPGVRATTLAALVQFKQSRRLETAALTLG